MSKIWPPRLFIESLLKCIQSLNEFVSVRAILRYQLELIQTGSFTVPSPWTGEALRPIDCFLTNNSPLGFGDIVIAYRFQCEHSFWLVAGVVKDGFPINEVYVPDLDLSLWRLYPETKSLNSKLLTQLQRLAPSSGAGAQKMAPILLLGHPNFAHNIWNELSGLAALQDMGVHVLDGLEVKTLCEPILAFEDAFFNLNIDHSSISDISSILGLKQRIYTRVGSTQISESLRSTLLESMCVNRDKSATTLIEKTLEGCDPVVWVSVRLDSRTASNQEEFIVSAATEIVNRYPKAAFILDGFSFPDDFDNKVYMQSLGAALDVSRLGVKAEQVSNLGEMLKVREQEISAYIDELKVLLSHSFDNPVVSISGFNMSTASYIGSLASYYICHAGTLQHKIGWLHNIPGFVHSNLEGVRPGAAGWMARQLENGIKPMLIDKSLVENLDSIRNLNQVERNRDYQIVDIEAAVAQIMVDIEEKLPTIAKDRDRAESDDC